MAAATGKESPKKVLSPEDLQRSLTRLTTVPKAPKAHDPFPVSPRVTKSSTEIENSVKRLYDVAIAHREKKQKDAAAAQEKAILEATKPKIHHDGADGDKGQEPLTNEDVQALAERLSTRSMQQQAASKQKALESLKQQLHIGSRGPTSPRVNVAEVNERVYTAAKKKRDERFKALYKKYVVATEPKCGRLTDEQIKESASRLSSRTSTPKK